MVHLLIYNTLAKIKRNEVYNTVKLCCAQIKSKWFLMKHFFFLQQYRRFMLCPVCVSVQVQALLLNYDPQWNLSRRSMGIYFIFFVMYFIWGWIYCIGISTRYIESTVCRIGKCLFMYFMNEIAVDLMPIPNPASSTAYSKV